jgi:hypothetical protein
MRGQITRIDPAPAGAKWIAHVTLEGAPRMVQGPRDDEPHEEPWLVEYWPELIEQWPAEAVRAWIMQRAAEQHERAAAQVAETNAAADRHADLLGSAEAAVVCHNGEIGCTEIHNPEGAGIDRKKHPEPAIRERGGA